MATSRLVKIAIGVRTLAAIRVLTAVVVTRAKMATSLIITCVPRVRIVAARRVLTVVVVTHVILGTGGQRAAMLVVQGVKRLCVT